jgi:alpha-glucosidase (family GH31 glycosyl hydrolase)
VFRGHGFVWRYHLPWSHGDKIEAICRRYLELRYRLMPYTYTLAWQAHCRGLPLMRPLVLNYPDDPRCWDLATQYLWGDDLLVAPVTRPGARQWPVHLPKGTWHDYWTGERHIGPGNVSVEAPLDRLPLFVRSGAIIPFGPVMQFDREREADAITLLTYPEGSSSFMLYEDDGVTNDYLAGRSARTSFACEADEKGLSCAVAAPEGEASLLPDKRSYTFKIHAPRKPRRVNVDGLAVPAEGATAGGAGWWHEEGFLHLRLAGRTGIARIDW